MPFWNNKGLAFPGLFGYDKKQAIRYIDNLERYLGQLKRAVFNKKNGLSFTKPQLDDSIPYPKKVFVHGYPKTDFENNISRLEIRISLEKSQLEME